MHPKLKQALKLVANWLFLLTPIFTIFIVGKIVGQKATSDDWAVFSGRKGFWET